VARRSASFFLCSAWKRASARWVRQSLEIPDLECQKNADLRILRAHHRIHHLFPAQNFGVTTTLWDWVWGTHYRSTKRADLGRMASRT
jgi:sterol desaturase/sphingolipid hydroxylase (fatty acid hydroxylase superfamily)